MDHGILPEALIEISLIISDLYRRAVLALGGLPAQKRT